MRLFWENIFGGRLDSEQVFKDEINQIEILTKTDKNPINFLQASFGPNLPGLPMDYLQNDVVIANPLDACSSLSNSAAVNGKIVLVEDGSLTAGSSCNYYKKLLKLNQQEQLQLLYMVKIQVNPIGLMI